MESWPKHQKPWKVHIVQKALVFSDSSRSYGQNDRRGYWLQGIKPATFYMQYVLYILFILIVKKSANIRAVSVAWARWYIADEKSLDLTCSARNHCGPRSVLLHFNHFWMKNGINVTWGITLTLMDRLIQEIHGPRGAVQPCGSKDWMSSGHERVEVGYCPLAEGQGVENRGGGGGQKGTGLDHLKHSWPGEHFQRSVCQLLGP